MAQPSITNYFNTRKRLADTDNHVIRAKKVLVLDSNKQINKERLEPTKTIICTDNDIKTHKKVIRINEGTLKAKKSRPKMVVKKNSERANRSIHDLLNDMTKTMNAEAIVREKHVTPPTTPTKSYNAMDKVKQTKGEASLQDIRQKLSRSARLAELKASISRFREGEKRLEEAEKKTSAAESPTLKTFKTLDLEVIVSPKKDVPIDKAYLSPKKDTAVRKNLLNLLSPTKNAVALPAVSPLKDMFTSTKPSLTLPYKYRSLAEIFRSIDTVCQILYNRKETITFRKLKSAYEQMMKKNLSEKHLGQIRTLFEDAFKFSQEKLRSFGTGTRAETWELVIVPNFIEDSVTSDILLARRRKLFSILIDKLKNYHREFLLSLDPPMDIPHDKITRWHPEFDIERVPDIEPTALPQPPDETKVTSGKEVLERAKLLFNCNTRMEEALALLEKHKQSQSAPTTEDPPQETQSVLKGIPKALLEKVRQRQAAKTLMNLTRSEDKEKEVQMYVRLPEIARVARNVFVAEKKSVLPLHVVIEKLENSYRACLSASELQEHLRLIEREVPGWLVFVDIRHSLYVKVCKSADVSLVISKLNDVAKKKAES